MCDPCRLAYNAYMVQWYAANSDKVKAWAKRYLIANKDTMAVAHNRWVEANKSRSLAIKSAYRARQRNALTIPFTADELSQRMAVWGNRCWMCGGDFEAVDHVIALARGGPHVLANLRPACKSCNCSKKARPWRELVA